MKKIMKRSVSLLLIAVLLCGAFSACSAKKEADPAGATTQAPEETTAQKKTEPEKKAEPLVIATNATLAPYEYYDGETVIGIDMDIASLLAGKLSREPVVKDLPFTDLFNALEEGEADIVIAAVNEEDAAGYNVFLTDVYTDDVQSLVTKTYAATARNQIVTLEDLTEKSVGVRKDASARYYAEKYIVTPHTVEFDKNTDVIAAILNGNVTAAVMRADIAEYYVGKTEGLNILFPELAAGHYVIAVADEGLRDRINGLLSKPEIKNEINGIVMKYVLDEDEVIAEEGPVGETEETEDETAAEDASAEVA